MKDGVVSTLGNFADVSIIVATYKASKAKLFQTIRSVLLQDAIGYEIIVTDDGSEIDYFNDLKILFKEFSFDEYQLITQINQGTVKNIAHSLKYVTKKYLKIISPGDLFYDKQSLIKWYQSMVDGKKVSFSIPVYYSMIDNQLQIMDITSNPSTLIPYKNKNDSHIEIHFYPRITLWYEYGDGISTMANEIWGQRLAADWEATDHIMQKMMQTMSDSFSWRYKKILDLKYSDASRAKLTLYTNLLFPILKIEKIKRHFSKINTPVNIENKEFFYQCL